MGEDRDPDRMLSGQKTVTPPRFITAPSLNSSSSSNVTPSAVSGNVM
jgi:hypothetical protein